MEFSKVLLTLSMFIYVVVVKNQKYFSLMKTIISKVIGN